MVSSKAIRVALYNKLNVSAVTTSLAAGSASLIHSSAPTNVAYPMLVFSRASETTTAMSFGGSHMDDDLWQVKVVAKDSSSSVAEDTAKAVYDALHFQPLNITGAEDLYLAREGAIDYTEVVSGVQYRHHGHYYRLKLQ